MRELKIKQRRATTIIEKIVFKDAIVVLEEGKNIISVDKLKELKVKVMEKRPPGALLFDPSPTPYTVLISYEQPPTLLKHEYSIKVKEAYLFRIRTIF